VNKGAAIANGTVTGYAGSLLTINAAINPAFNNANLTGFVIFLSVLVTSTPSRRLLVCILVMLTSGGISRTLPKPTILPLLFSNVSLATGNAPQGHFLFSAFDQQKAIISAISGLNPITTFFVLGLDVGFKVVFGTQV